MEKLVASNIIATVSSYMVSDLYEQCSRNIYIYLNKTISPLSDLALQSFASSRP